MYKETIKPVFDYIGGSIALLLTSPILLVIAIIYLIQGNKDIIFQQYRIGKNEKIFIMYKFRTINDNCRPFPYGDLLRSFSLDELPQIWNVLKGEMSLVGPRPLLVDYLQHFNKVQRQRHLVKPGITGWAQVNGRNKLDWTQRLALDCYYVKQLSLFLDLKILLLTIRQWFKISEVRNKDLKRFDDPH